MSVHIYFDSGHTAPIKKKTKRLTMRYDWDKEVPPDRIIRFVDGDNLYFGNAVLLDQYTMSVQEILETDWIYHTNYRNMSEFSNEFENYYSNVDFKPETKITVIEWGKTFRPNAIYEFA